MAIDSIPSSRIPEGDVLIDLIEEYQSIQPLQSKRALSAVIRVALTNHLIISILSHEAMSKQLLAKCVQAGLITESVLASVERNLKVSEHLRSMVSADSAGLGVGKVDTALSAAAPARTVLPIAPTSAAHLPVMPSEVARPMQAAPAVPSPVSPVPVAEAPAPSPAQQPVKQVATRGAGRGLGANFARRDS